MEWFKDKIGKFFKELSRFFILYFSLLLLLSVLFFTYQQLPDTWQVVIHDWGKTVGYYLVLFMKYIEQLRSEGWFKLCLKYLFSFYLVVNFGFIIFHLIKGPYLNFLEQFKNSMGARWFAFFVILELIFSFFISYLIITSQTVSSFLDKCISYLPF